MRIEVLLTAAWAEKLVELLVEEFEGEALTAYVQEVDALPRSHFLAPPPAVTAPPKVDK